MRRRIVRRRIVRRRLVAAVAATLVLGSVVVFGPLAAIASAASAPDGLLSSSQVQVTTDVVFADMGGLRLTLDVFAPKVPRAQAPTVVLIHGGAWGAGTARDLNTEGMLLARQGWVAFSISYRLSDQTPTPWPDELTDAQRAVRWVGAHAGTYGADAQKLVVMGFSAGGHLAAMIGAIGTAVDGTGAQLSDPNPPVKVSAVAAWSPPTRLAGLVPDAGGNPPDCAGNKECTLFWRLPLVTGFMHCQPAVCPDRYAQASPASRVTPTAAPTWLANSTSEIVAWPQAETYDRALASAGVAHRLRSVNGSRHADQYISTVWNEMMPWLAARIGVPDPPAASFGSQNALLSPVVIIPVVAGLAILLTILAVALHDRDGEL